MDEKPLKLRTISELKRICKDNDVICEPKMTKSNILELLEELDMIVIKPKAKGKIKKISKKSKPSIFAHIETLETYMTTYKTMTALQKSQKRAEILEDMKDKLENFDWGISDNKFKTKVEEFVERLLTDSDESAADDGTMDFEEENIEVKPSIGQRLPHLKIVINSYKRTTNPNVKRNLVKEMKTMLQIYDWTGYEDKRKFTEEVLLAIETIGNPFDDIKSIVKKKLTGVRQELPDLGMKGDDTPSPPKPKVRLTPIQKYVPGVYKPIDMGLSMKVIKKGDINDIDISKQRITITLDEFRKEIKKPSFVNAFANSARELMRAKKIVYEKRLGEIKKEYDSLKLKVFRLRASGTSDSTIREMYPGYDTMGAYIIDIENIIDIVTKRRDSITEIEISEGLEDALEDPDDGIASLMGRTEIKNQLASQLYSFSKGYKTFFGNFNNIMITGPAGSGKCLHPDTPVMLYSGVIKKAKDVKVGDKLMGDDSTPRNVLSVCSGNEEMYKISPLKGDYYVVNKPHIISLKRSCKPVLCWDGNNAYKINWRDSEGINRSKIFTSAKTWKESKKQALLFKESLSKDEFLDISVEEYIKKSPNWKKQWKGYRVGTNFEPSTEKLAIDPYLLGLWLDDGTKRCTSLTNIDPEIVVHLAGHNEMENISNVSSYMNSQDGISYYIGGTEINNTFLKELQRYGLMEYKVIPHIYKTASRKDRLKLLAGIIDTNGIYNGNCYDIIQKSNNLTKDILFVARSCGFAAYSTKYKNIYLYDGKYKEEEYNKIILSGYLQDIPVLLPSKKCSTRKNTKDVLKMEIKVESIGEGSYCGFELDGNHRFLLGDFTVTHNTRLAKTIAFAFSKVCILARNIVKITTRTEIVGQYIGHTAPRTRGVLLETLEGILFIDEAYQLTPCPEDRGGSKDFGSEAITEMVNFLDKYIGLNIVIVAGYEALMNRCFMTANEGLPRRFPYRYVLSAYTVPELTDILLNNLKRKVRDGVIIDAETGNFLYSLTHKLFTEIPEVFKNQAGDMLNLSSNINNAINSSYHIDWVNQNLENNKKILFSGFEDFLESKGYSITFGV